MRIISVQVDEHLVEAAEARARLEHTTLDEKLQTWLADYAGQSQRVREAMAVVSELQRKLRTGGRKFSRDEMKER